MTTTMQQGFLDDIIAHPEDDTPRLIYADWLQDHGEEESRRKFPDSPATSTPSGVVNR